MAHGEAGSGIYSDSREAGLTGLWWIQGAISATLTVMGVDKITTKGPLQCLGFFKINLFIYFIGGTGV
jgi:hypothetical protein